LQDLEKGSSFFADAGRRFLKNRAAVFAGAVLLAMIIACVLAPSLSHYRYAEADLKLGPTPPSFLHWMGTDYFGRDLLARVFFGGRIAFAVAILATLMSFFIGITWGGIS